MAPWLTPVVFLASVRAALALKVSANETRGAGGEMSIEVELYHVAFGQKRVTRDAVVQWAGLHIGELGESVQTVINTWPGLSAKQLVVHTDVLKKPSETRAGGSEETFLSFRFSGISADDLTDELRAAVKKAVLDKGRDFGGAIVQEPVYKTLEAKRQRRRDEAASGKGDPHLTNMHGERFDLYQPGVHTLLQIPRRADDFDTLLRVQADARRLGGMCADLYFQTVNITGSWSPQDGGFQYFAESGPDSKLWTRFGEVELKIKRGKTDGGIVYLNVFVKHLARVSHSVGGLLGEDDHEAAATPGRDCTLGLDLHADASIADAIIEG